MSNPIRAALERLVELEDKRWGTSTWDDAVAAARAALAEQQVEGPTLEEVEELLNRFAAFNIECLQGLINDALARWGRQPAPLVAGAPGPSMEDVGPLIAWLTEQACQAADASQPADAGMLTWAAQVIGERVNEDAPVAGEVAELVDRLRRASDGASAMGWEQDSWAIARAAELLQQQHPTPVPVSERLPGPGEMDGSLVWCGSQAAGLPYWEWCLDDIRHPCSSGYTHWLPANTPALPTALPLPQGEVECGTLLVPAPTPVPVSERLPGDQLCWWYEPDEDDGYGGGWTLLRIRGGTGTYSHWLPAHALPLPAVEVEK